MKKFILMLLMIFVTSGCSLYRIDSEDVATFLYPEKPASEVTYLENVDKPHEVIGFITVNAERSKSMDAIIRKMKREAGLIGGDAITNLQTNATGTWKKIRLQKLLGNAFIRAKFSATVVVFQK
ncbi:MAG: hypothetical protein KAJ18_07645 [Candidatus Omnitrophica bacterium]|nr:hypothetical protein [Candidatus Omnitrophota bacterium]